MNILKRPGWANFEIIEEAGAGGRSVRKPEYERQIFKLHAGGELPSAKYMQSPQTEVYRFVGQVILNHPELRAAFPDFGEARKLKSNHFEEVDANTLEQLKSELDVYYSDVDKFKEILSQLHATRRTRDVEEFTKGGYVDTREKHQKWERAKQRVQGPSEQPTETTPGAQPEEEWTPESEARVGSAQFQINFLPLFFKIPVTTAEDEMMTVRDLDDDIVNAIWSAVSDAKDIFEVMENLSDLAVSGKGDVGSYANEIFEVLKNELVSGADEVVDQAETNPGMPAHLSDYFTDFKKQKAEHAAKYSAPTGKVRGKHGAKGVEADDAAEVDKQFEGAEEVGEAAAAWLRARQKEGLLSPELDLTPEEKEKIKKNALKNYEQARKAREKQFPESTKLTAKQVDQVLLEQRRRAAQYRAVMEERYGR